MEHDAYKNISVIGAGAWGTALAHMLADAGKSVTLFARNAALADAINATHENKPYLEGCMLSSSIRATADMAQAAQSAEMIVLATPAQHMRAMLKNLAPHAPRGVPLVNTAKGIELETGTLLSAIAAEEAPHHPYAVLSGPTFASEVVKGLPAAATLATRADEATARLCLETLRGRAFRPYLSRDVLGAEIAGALKNVVAIACGIVDGRALGQNAKAAVMTRGLAEIRRLGVRIGADAETFMGLSGLGDLTLTCHSMTSRNFSLGHALGCGQKLADIMAKRRTVAEGVATAAAAATFAQKAGVDMPINAAVDAILHAGADIGATVSALLARDLRFETA